MSAPSQLVNAFENIKAREQVLRTILKEVIPSYAAKASDAKAVIETLIDG